MASARACVSLGIVFGALGATNAFAQSIEPRAYSPGPVGTNFAILAYTESRGAIPTDPALPISDIDLKVHAALLAYSRSLDLFGKSGKLDVIGVALNLSAYLNSADDPGYSTTEWRSGLLAWRDVGRATFTAEAQYGKLRADERLILFPEKRSDEYYSISLGATFRRFQVGGFAPITRITFERNKSSVEFYDYKRTRTEFGITRAF